MTSLGTILVVDDDALVLEVLVETFCDDYCVVAASSGPEALQALEKYPDINAVVLDIRMKGMDGLEAAVKIREIRDDVPIVFHTGYPGDYSETEVQEQYQPFDYVGKHERPIRLERAVRNAVAFHRLTRNRDELVQRALNAFGMVGSSRQMQAVYRAIARVAPSNSKVMILGATGTGKELVARSIHAQSSRASRRLVIFNCSHKPQDLVVSELFGHLKGSFTGAIEDRVGMFEYADSGTLFLDEIGDLDIATQVKLLRVLESGEMSRIGSPEVIKVDVRLICATHRDLPQMVKDGTFREDLYYRLKGITILLPPLKERREDIPELIDLFVARYCAHNDTGIKVFQSEARQLLIEYDWPGNVRQLLDAVQSLVDLTPSFLVSKADVEKYLDFQGSIALDDGGFKDRIREYKRILIIQALDRAHGNLAVAARHLSLDPSNLRKMAKSLDLI